MSNETKVHDLVFKDGHRHFRNNSVFVNALGAQYDGRYSAHGASAGDSIRIMQPQEFGVSDGPNIDVQDVDEKTVTISRSVWKHIAFKYSTAEMIQDVDSFNETKVKPAMATLASYVDNYGMNTIVKEVANCVTLPVTSLDRDDVLEAGVRLDDNSTPRDGSRKIILAPRGMSDVVSDSSGLFNNAANVSQQYNDGIVKVPSFGFDFGSSANVPSFTTGSRNTSYVTDGVGVEGASTLDVDTGTGTALEGESFTIADVYEVNPLTKQSTGTLKQFRVTADSAGGTATLAIEPALISTGAYQNIDSLPADGVAVTFMGAASTSYRQNLAFHPQFAACGFADIQVDAGEGAKSSRKVEDGVSMAMTTFFDGKTMSRYMRFDILFGFKTVIPRQAVRLFQPS